MIFLITKNEAGVHDQRAQVSKLTPEVPRTHVAINYSSLHSGNADSLDWPYIIELANGTRLEGRTDKDGKTAKIKADMAEDATLHVYQPDTTRINPRWDQ